MATATATDAGANRPREESVFLALGRIVLNTITTQFYYRAELSSISYIDFFKLQRCYTRKTLRHGTVHSFQKHGHSFGRDRRHRRGRCSARTRTAAGELWGPLRGPP